MSSLLLGVLGSLVAAILSAVGVAGFRVYRKGKGLFVGTWEQIIPAVNEQPLKRDLVTCFQHGERIRGTIQRVEPTSENWKRWGFEGRVREQVLAATFWSEDPGVNSFGIMLLVHSGEHRYDGYYTKHRPAERDIDRIAEERERVRFQWVKQRVSRISKGA